MQAGSVFRITLILLENICTQGGEGGWLDRIAEDHRRMGQQFLQGLRGTHQNDLKDTGKHQHTAPIESAADVDKSARILRSSARASSPAPDAAMAFSNFGGGTTGNSLDGHGEEDHTHEAWTALLQAEAKALSANSGKDTAAARDAAHWEGSHSTHTGLEAQDAADYEARLLAAEVRASVVGSQRGQSSDDEDGGRLASSSGSSSSGSSSSSGGTGSSAPSAAGAHGHGSSSSGVAPAAPPASSPSVPPVVVALVTQTHTDTCDSTSDAEDEADALMPLQKAVQLLAAQGGAVLLEQRFARATSPTAGSDSDGEGGGMSAAWARAGAEALGPSRFLGLPEAPFDAPQLDAAALAAAVLLQREGGSSGGGAVAGQGGLSGAAGSSSGSTDDDMGGDAHDDVLRAAVFRGLAQEPARPGASVSAEDLQLIFGPRRSA